MDIGGNKIKAVQSRLDMINGQIDQTTGHINKANVAIKTAKRYVVIYIHFFYFVLSDCCAVQSKRLWVLLLAMSERSWLWLLFVCYVSIQ